MTVNIYKGEYISAESAYSYFDAEAIINGCQKLKKIAGELSRGSKKIVYSKDYCSQNSLYVQGETFTDEIEYCAKLFNESADRIDDYANALMKNLQTALDNKQAELNKIAKEKEANIEQSMAEKNNDDSDQKVLEINEKSQNNNIVEFNTSDK